MAFLQIGSIYGAIYQNLSNKNYVGTNYDKEQNISDSRKVKSTAYVKDPLKHNYYIQTFYDGTFHEIQIWSENEFP